MHPLVLMLLVLVTGGVCFLLLVVIEQVAEDLTEAVSVYRGVPTRVVCPMTGRPVRVRVKLDQARHPGHAILVRCQRHPGGPPRCTRGCLTEALRRLGAAGDLRR